MAETLAFKIFRGSIRKLFQPHVSKLG